MTEGDRNVRRLNLGIVPRLGTHVVRVEFSSLRSRNEQNLAPVLVAMRKRLGKNLGSLPITNSQEQTEANVVDTVGKAVAWKDWIPGGRGLISINHALG